MNSRIMAKSFLFHHTPKCGKLNKTDCELRQTSIGGALGQPKASLCNILDTVANLKLAREEINRRAAAIGDLTF